MQYAYSANIAYALRICQEKNQDHFADINEMVEKHHNTGNGFCF